MDLLPFVEFAINTSAQDIIGLSLQKVVLGKVLWASVDLVEDLHPIEAAQLLVSEVQGRVK